MSFQGVLRLCKLALSNRPKSIHLPSSAIRAYVQTPLEAHARLHTFAATAEPHLATLSFARAGAAVLGSPAYESNP
jgi:hypothetical protein